MEQIIDTYRSGKKIVAFMMLLKDSINWLCLAKE